MKESVGTVVLLNRTTSAFESAEVFQELDQKNLDDFNRLWKPMLKNRRDEFPSWTAAADANVQDSHWDWVGKAEHAARSMQYETFAVECAGQTQGLMLVDVTKFAQLDGQQGRELVYIELLATAPWNRRKLVPTPVYKGVGRVLVGTAISLSVELGFKGRIGLHSLRQSESWYETEASFIDGGYNPVQGMQYFEMTEAQAAAFISDH
ncbi:MAG: hypothetical protein ACYDBH_11850 [Acidobacteriaceae bacterium]